MSNTDLEWVHEGVRHNAQARGGACASIQQYEFSVSHPEAFHFLTFFDHGQRG